MTVRQCGGLTRGTAETMPTDPCGPRVSSRRHVPPAVANRIRGRLPVIVPAHSHTGTGECRPRAPHTSRKFGVTARNRDVTRYGGAHARRTPTLRRVSAVAGLARLRTQNSPTTAVRRVVGLLVVPMR